MNNLEEVPVPQYFMTLLNETGDTSITWDEPDDVEVLTYIQKKMDEGYVFFIERPVIIRAFMKKRKIDNVSSIKRRKLIVADEAAAKLELNGKIKRTKLDYGKEDHSPVKRAKTALEVASGRSFEFWVRTIFENFLAEKNLS